MKKKPLSGQQKSAIDQYMPVLLKSPLLEGFSEDALRTLLTCYAPTVQTYSKGETIFTAGERVERIGIILEGYVDTVQEDFWGNQMLLGRFRPGQIFADSFVLAQADAIPFSAYSVRKTVVMYFEYRQILQPCEAVCGNHVRLVANLLSISAKKNIFLLTKINHITKHSAREKILSYLSWESRKLGKSRFSIQYNRQGLANYLAMDRSTLSTELARMQREGILSYNRNEFELHKESYL